MSALIEKARKLKFVFLALSISVVSQIAAFSCASVTKQRLSRLQRVHVQAAA
jgi:hypothetical protein